MADRTTKVVLSAEISNYVANMERAARSTRDVGTAAERLAAQRQGFDVLGRSMVAVGAVAAATVALAVSKFTQFDAAMSNVKAATQESASNMSLLRDAALDAGGATVFSATEAAGAIENLAKAGVSTADVLNGGLNGALSLAAAGELEVGRAAEIAASALTQFNLEGADIPHVADLLAAGAGKAQGSVDDLGQALNQSGLVASQMGLSLEETTGSLAAFASAGLVGSDAGTSFRQMLLRLANPTNEAKDLMDELGVAAYDASGNFVGMESLAGQLQGRLSGLTQSQRDSALATIFGSDAIRAANVLYTQGAEGVAEWTSKVTDSGYASKVAADRLDNLQGDLEKLGGAFDTAFIQSGAAANDVLRGLVQSLTFVVDAVAELPAPVLGTGLALGGLVTTVGLVGGTALIAIPRIVEFKAALTALGVSGKAAAIGIGAAGAAISAATLLIGTQISVMAESSGRVDSFADSLDQATGSITDYTRELVAMRLEESGAFGDAERMGIGMELVTDAAMGNASAISELKERSQEWLDQSGLVERYVNGNVFAYDNLRQSVRFTSEELEDGKDKLATTKEALGDVEGSTADAGDALSDLGTAAADANGAIDALAASIRGFGSAQLDVNEATRNVEAALDDFNETLSENGKVTDVSTAAGRANQQAVDSTAQAYLELAASTLEQTGSQSAATAVIKEGRAAVIAQRMALGDTKREAQDYANKLGLIPKNVSTAVSLNGVGAAQTAIDNFIWRNNNKRININVGTSMGGALAQNISENGNLYDQGKAIAFADGGFASGIYSGSDGPLYKFAEPNTRWEAYISGKPGQEARNREIWAEAGKRLGVGPVPSGGQTTVVNNSFTNYYPQNEPNSETVRKAGQIIGALVTGGLL